jgi:hypothetical protein
MVRDRTTVWELHHRPCAEPGRLAPYPRPCPAPPRKLPGRDRHEVGSRPIALSTGARSPGGTGFGRIDPWRGVQQLAESGLTLPLCGQSSIS